MEECRRLHALQPQLRIEATGQLLTSANLPLCNQQQYPESEASWAPQPV